MRVAVITPYYKEDLATILLCRDSVAAQTHSCTHVFVADGFPLDVIDSWDVLHLTSSVPHADVGNTPRILGALSAFSFGFDAVAFLDADNWYRPEHVARMVALHRRTGAAICTASRSMHRPDGSYMFDDDKCDGRDHVDSNCFFITRQASGIVARWAMMPRELAPIGDTVYFESLVSQGVSRAHEREPTVCYRTTWASDFARLNETPPGLVKTRDFTDAPFRWIKGISAEQKKRLRHEIGWPPSLRFRAAKRMRAYLTAVPRFVTGGREP